MRLFILYIVLGVIMIGCNNENKSTTNDSSIVVGKYINTYEPNVVHYVEIKKDSTYLHYYKKANEVALENSGKWKLVHGKTKTEVIFNSWIDYGYEDEPVCNKCLRAVKFENNELIFSVDLPDELNFIKTNLN